MGFYRIEFVIGRVFIMRVLYDVLQDISLNVCL